MFFFRLERTPQGIYAGIVVLLSLLYVGATFAAVGRQLAGPVGGMVGFLLAGGVSYVLGAIVYTIVASATGASRR